MTQIHRSPVCRRTTPQSRCSVPRRKALRVCGGIEVTLGEAGPYRSTGWPLPTPPLTAFQAVFSTATNEWVLVYKLNSSHREGGAAS